MIIDGHLHLGGPFAETHRLLKSMDEAGINKAVVVPYMYKDGKDVKVFGLPPWLAESQLAVFVVDRVMQNRWYRKRFTERPDNAKVLKLVQQYPHRFMGFYWLNPNIPQDIDEMEALVAQGQFAGIKLHQVIHPFDIAGRSARRVFDIADTYRIPVFLHAADRDTCRQFISIAEKHPGARFIIAHLIHYEVTVQAVARLKNLFYDISPLCLPKAEKIFDVVKTAGAGKLVFGTDTPCPGGQKYAVQKILGLNLTQEEKAAILGGNLLRILHTQEETTENVPITRQPPVLSGEHPPARTARYPGN
jgi:predicted TIM-barrel fold metal-dependent hydrolase